MTDPWWGATGPLFVHGSCPTGIPPGRVESRRGRCYSARTVMKLDVLPPQQQQRKGPWYADGLDFTCTQCGNCCGGAPGYVWLERDDIVRIAEFLKVTPEEMV